MNKQEFFLTAMRAEEFRRKAWVISAFCVIAEGPDDWKKDPYPYRIVQTAAGSFFVDPTRENQLTRLDDAPKGQAPFGLKERVSFTKDHLPEYLTQTVTATYGQWITNFVVNFWPFGKKLGFIAGRFTTAVIEEMLLKRLADEPTTEAKERLAGERVPVTVDAFKEPIYVSEYLNFCDAAFYMAGFTQVCVPAATPKSMVPAPGIKELRDKLLAENKDRLHDPAVIAKIDAELVRFDREYLKGDPSENFLLGKKSFEVVRKKMFSMHGAEVGLEEKVDVELIKSSLSEGWDISKFPAMNNSLRAGSFNRGAQTMLGGESVKWLLRASSNVTVTQDDCGSVLGNIFEPTEENFKWLTGFAIVQGTGHKQVVSDEDAKSYIGKKLVVRSPMYCKLDKTDYCKVCVGARLAENPTALSSAISEYGSTFLSIYMAAAHGKALQLEKMEIKTAIT
jgi:hypothetical protein